VSERRRGSKRKKLQNFFPFWRSTFKGLKRGKKNRMTEEQKVYGMAWDYNSLKKSL